jgi:hypothetical protein
MYFETSLSRFICLAAEVTFIIDHDEKPWEVEEYGQVVIFVLSANI